MRTFVLLFAFAIPPLVACCGAYAHSATGIGKPVCTRFDDAASKPDRVASAQAASAAKPVPATATASASEPATAVAQPKGGGASEVMRPRNEPHWQTFLPGMFR